MINIQVDEGYAFDYLSILYIKKDRSVLAHDAWERCTHVIQEQLADKFHTIVNSQEYADMISANLATFNMVDLAKDDKCTARDVDYCNYQRYKAKIALQSKFFNTTVTEIKVGYEKYEN